MTFIEAGMEYQRGFEDAMNERGRNPDKHSDDVYNHGYSIGMIERKKIEAGMNPCSLRGDTCQN